ncbi:hypothetical protein N7491_000706 [Penicillium cf. griseofulvum]|nr:hypothetical protein N7491_000706 [Penicillium cf. griseofulvum]
MEPELPLIPRGETRDTHGIFHTFPHLKEYRTKDLFSPHLARPNLWKYEGRLDDTITLNNGQKINPVSMEKVVESHPLVSRAVVIGNRRSHVALLVELAVGSDFSFASKSSVADLVRAIWPVVEKANKLAPGGGQIGIMRIGLASPDKPFRTTPKGSTQRRMVLEDYEEEIEKIYQHDAF